MQTADIYARSLNRGYLRELAGAEKFSLIGELYGLVFQEGEHCSSVVCESKRSLTRIDSLRAEDGHGLRMAFSAVSCSSRGELAASGLDEK